ncbi:RICIN domain-containing protein [Streptomyces rectiviolaceus]
MNLAARLRDRPEGESGRPIALLLERHWQSTYDYAAICLATSASSASMVATASFHQALGHMTRGEPLGALRPHLLVTVRETVRGWVGDDRISALMPELRKPTGGRGMRAARSMTLEKRQLAARSFWALPGVAQCLLWHTEVEAEHISVPAGLSGLSADTAADALEQALEQFRADIVRAHRELAATKECPLYNRLLDVTIRRGGSLLPDVQQHLSECRHCSDVADQLSHFESGLGTLLAEAVLGWGARRYLQSRPGRGGPATRGAGSAGHGGRHAGSGGRHRPAARIPLPGGALVAARTHSRALRTGAALGSAALLAAVLVTTLSSGDGDGGGSVSPTGMAGSREAPPGADSEAPPAGSPAPTSAEYPGSSDQGRLRNEAADLCLDIRGGKVKPGAGTKLAKCSNKASQQWSYEENGLLSSVPHPDLCLDSHRDDGVIVLGACVAPSAAHADEVRYDLTVQGELLPRWHEGIAVAPASLRKGADVVVKVRDGSAEQRWMLDSSKAAPNSRSIGGRAAPSETGAPSEKGDLSVKGDPSVKGGPEAPRGNGDVCTGSICEPTSPREQGSGPRGDGAKDNGRQSSPYSTRRGDAEKRYAEAGWGGGDAAEPVAPKLPGEHLRSPAAESTAGIAIRHGGVPGGDDTLRR